MDKKEPIDPGSFRYIIFEPKSTHPLYVEHLDKVYQFWKQSWGDILKGLDGKDSISAIDFFRQDYIASLWLNDEVVGVHLYNLFDLKPNCIFEHPYFQNGFNLEYFKFLRANDFKKALSMEYLFVSPVLRKSSGVMNMALVLGNLGMHVFLEMTDAEVSVAPARKDLKVTEIGYRLGWEPVVQDFQLHNVPVDLVACRRKNVKLNNIDLVELKNYLWAKREIASQSPRLARLKVA